MRSFPEIFGYDEVSNREQRHHLGCEYDSEKRLILEERYKQIVQAELQRFTEEQQNLMNIFRTEHSRIVKQLINDQDRLVMNHIQHHLGGVDLVWETYTASELKELATSAAWSWTRIQQEVLNKLHSSRNGHQTNMSNFMKGHMKELENLNLGLATAQWMVMEIPIVPDEPTWTIASTTAARTLRRAKTLQQYNNKASNTAYKSPEGTLGPQVQSGNDLEANMQMPVDTKLVEMTTVLNFPKKGEASEDTTENSLTDQQQWKVEELNLSRKAVEALMLRYRKSNSNEANLSEMADGDDDSLVTLSTDSERHWHSYVDLTNGQQQLSQVMPSPTPSVLCPFETDLVRPRDRSGQASSVGGGSFVQT